MEKSLEFPGPGRKQQYQKNSCVWYPFKVCKRVQYLLQITSNISAFVSLVLLLTPALLIAYMKFIDYEKEVFLIDPGAHQ